MLALAAPLPPPATAQVEPFCGVFSLPDGRQVCRYHSWIGMEFPNLAVVSLEMGVHANNLEQETVGHESGRVPILLLMGSE